MCDLNHNPLLQATRRQLLGGMMMGLGSMALGEMAPATDTAKKQAAVAAGLSQFAPKAKRVIFLFQSGGPSQLDLFDHKPLLQTRNGEQLPDAVRKGQRLTGMSGNQSSLPLAGAQFKFAQHGNCGSWVSELLPYTANIVDELWFSCEQVETQCCI
jgi:hypothetical protein